MEKDTLFFRIVGCFKRPFCKHNFLIQEKRKAWLMCDKCGKTKMRKFIPAKEIFEAFEEWMASYTHEEFSKMIYGEFKKLDKIINDNKDIKDESRGK